MTRQSNFIPVDKLGIKCGVCGRDSYCEALPDLTRFKCKRPEFKHLPDHNYVPVPKKSVYEGQVYVLRDLSTVDNYKPKPIIYVPKQEEEEQDFSELAKIAFMRADRKRYALSLGVSEESCSLLRVGLTSYYRKDIQCYADAWTIPMRNADKKIIGIRLEYCSDRIKRGVKGSRNGLIMFPYMKPCQEPLFVPEGASDVLAGHSMGLRELAGKPGRLAGLKYLIEYGKKCYRPLIIISDRDVDGLEGAKYTANGVGNIFKYVKIVMPPPGYKDLRAWYNSGKASLDKLMCIVNNTKEYKIKL